MADAAGRPLVSRSPGQPPRTAAAEPSTVSAVGSASIQPQRRGGHGGRTPTARHVRRAGTVRVGGVRAPVNSPGCRTLWRCPRQRSRCRLPLYGMGPDTDRRYGMGLGHQLSSAASGPVGVHRYNDKRTCHRGCGRGPQRFRHVAVMAPVAGHLIAAGHTRLDTPVRPRDDVAAPKDRQNAGSSGRSSAEFGSVASAGCAEAEAAFRGQLDADIGPGLLTGLR